MFLQENVRLMDEFALSLEDAMHEDQGTSFVCNHKVNLFPKVARTDMRGQDNPED
jgi:hypothetical protein